MIIPRSVQLRSRFPSRTAAPEQHRNDETHHNGCRGIAVPMRRGSQRAVAPSAPQRQPGADGDAKYERYRGGTERYQGRAAEHLRNSVHQPLASAWKSGSPYWSTPKRPISFWVSGATIQSENS